MRWLRWLDVCSLAFVSVAGIGCDEEAHDLGWEIAFSTPALRARAAVVEARIATGGCKSDDLVYLSHFDPGKPGRLPPELAPGRYGFSARAQDRGCRWFAAGCEDVSLPARAPNALRVSLGALATEALDCDSPACGALSCGSSSLPARDAAADDDASVDAASNAATRIVRELEAEDARDLRAPFARFDDATASGGAYIAFPGDPMATLEERQNQKRGTPPSSDADGIAVYTFELPRADSYRMWGRVISPSLDSDSFWIQIDDQPFIQWNDIAHGDQWLWVDVRDFERRSDTHAFELAAGRHSLRVSYRELGTSLDALLLSSDLGYVPNE